MSPWAAESDVSSRIRGSVAADPASARLTQQPTPAARIEKPISDPPGHQTSPKPRKLLQELSSPRKGSRNTDETKENLNGSNYASSFFTGTPTTK